MEHLTTLQLPNFAIAMLKIGMLCILAALGVGWGQWLINNIKYCIWEERFQCWEEVGEAVQLSLHLWSFSSLSTLGEVEEEEGFPPVGSHGSVAELDILDGIFQNSIKRKECSLHPCAKMGSIAYCCCWSVVLCCRREIGSIVVERNSNWKRLFLPTFLAEEWSLQQKRSTSFYDFFYTRLCQIWVFPEYSTYKIIVVCVGFSREYFIFYDLHWANTLCCFILDLMNCDQRFFHCSCFCPFCKMQDLSSGQMRCLLMLLSSTFVLHCRKMESHQFQKFLNFHFPYFLPSSQTLRLI